MLRAGTTEDLSGFQLGTHDAWGNPIWLASDGEHYAVWSYGADGVVDDTWVSADLVFDVATDIIIVDGNFIHYNAGMGAIEGSGLENLVNTAKQLAGAHGPQ
jgi:hypothetical protein